MRRVFIAAAAIALAWQASGQETRQQRGKRVVYEALKALGGDAFQRMQDRVESGRAYSFYNRQLNGLTIATIYTRYLAPVPGKVAMRESEVFGKRQDEGGVLFTEEGGWDYNYHGARPLDDQTYARYLDSTLRNVFYILRQRLDEPGMDFYSQGSDRFENQQVEIVDITDGSGATVTVYFSQNSKLPIRQSFRRKNPTYGDFDTEVSIFGKYRDVGGGVMWPYDIRRERNGQKIYEMYSDSVEINKNLTDNLFSLPAKLKVLPKSK
jgi:hypothetical protein